MANANPRVLFAGTPEFAAQCLLQLIGSQFKPAAVLTQPDRPSGRGRKLTPSPVKALAMAHDLPVLQPQSLRDGASFAEVSAHQPDVLVVVAYGLILPKSVLNLPPKGCINVHASLLPRWRGAAPIERAFLAGDTETGVSIMAMDEGLDTGPVYLTRKLPISGQTTIDDLYASLAMQGGEALLVVLQSLFSNQPMQPVAQSEEGITYAAKLTNQDRTPDWCNQAVQLARQISALSARMPVRTTIDNQQGTQRGLQLLRARPMDDTMSRDAIPGEIIHTDPGGIQVQCATGVLQIESLKPDGKGVVDAKQAINGYPDLFRPGSRFL